MGHAAYRFGCCRPPPQLHFNLITLQRTKRESIPRQDEDAKRSLKDEVHARDLYTAENIKGAEWMACAIGFGGRPHSAVC